jgi:tetratricopeptide (TPR) repeat protein
MREILAQQAGLVWALLASPIVPIGVFFLLRHRRQRRSTPAAPVPNVAPLPAAERAPKVDSAALAEAAREAEAGGETAGLPDLYLSLAQCRIEAGETADAEELLRKCIRGAASAELKETHARARLMLGDLAHESGDLTTACEHWQIARALFHELKQTRDHELVESRMLCNGCPTDWVLTDF